MDGNEEWDKGYTICFVADSFVAQQKQLLQFLCVLGPWASGKPGLMSGHEVCVTVRWKRPRRTSDFRVKKGPISEVRRGSLL